MYNTSGVNTSERGRKQRTLRINLNIANAEERLVQDICEWWKLKKEKASNIRRAILLFADLQDGGIDRLLVEFPHVYAAIRSRVVEQYADEHARRLREIEDYIGGKEAEILAASRTPPPAAPPQPERVALETTTAKTSAAEVADNFLSGLSGLFE